MPPELCFKTLYNLLLLYPCLPSFSVFRIQIDAGDIRPDQRCRVRIPQHPGHGRVELKDYAGRGGAVQAKGRSFKQVLVPVLLHSLAPGQ